MSLLLPAVIPMNEPDDTAQRSTERSVAFPARTDASGALRAYVRFAAVGDSATYGLGDKVDGGWRGWAALLADAIAGSHDVSYCNLARVGATAGDVRQHQVTDAALHRPHLASLVVGLNDTMRSSWDDHLVTNDLLGCAQRLDDAGSLLLTVKFHDHSELLPLPRVLRRHLSRRIAVLNAAYDEIHARHGGFQVDLSASPEATRREFWSVDRLHPSELGHRVLAYRFATLLNEAGLAFEPPSRNSEGGRPSRRENLRWLVTEGGPWVGRRTRDLGPWAARQALLQARLRLA